MPEPTQHILSDLIPSRLSDDGYRALIEEVPAVIYIAAPGEITTSLYVSPQIERMTGFPAAEFLADPHLWAERLHPEDRERVLSTLANMVSSGRRGTVEYRLIAHNNRTVWVRDEIDFVRDASGAITYIRGVMLDITTQKDAEELLHQRDERFRALVQNASDIITLLDASGSITYQSPALESVLGYSASVALGQPAFRRVHPDDRERAEALLRDVMSLPGQAIAIELRFPHANGYWRTLELIATNLLDHASIQGIVINARDVTERQTIQEQLRQQAFYDPLTGLANRALLMDRIAHALARVERDGHQIAVIFLDLDRFKVINDSLGHAAGDQLLIRVGERLMGCLRTVDTVARLGGDEFVILIEDVSDHAQVAVVAERVIAMFQEPICIEGYEAFVSTSIGIAISNTGPEGGGELIRSADIALYRAKGEGRGRYVVFDPSMNVSSAERLAMETDLRRAIERGELRLAYQPEINLSTGQVIALEALVRWEHPTRGFVPPEAFIPLAEETGFVVPIGHWVLEHACRQARLWQDQPDKRSVVVSVNLSGKELEYPGLVEVVDRVLRETGADPRLLRLEITESVIVQEASSSRQTLQRLKELGVQIAIDDFGIGYSSLAYLTRLCADMVKVDRSFVTALDSDPRSLEIFGAIVSLAHALDMDVTAEGIESAAQLDAVRRAGCDHAQGLHLSEPIPADAVLAILRR